MDSTTQLQSAFARLTDELAGRGGAAVRAEDILLALLDSSDTAASRALDEAGVDRARVRRKLDDTLPHRSEVAARTCYPYHESGLSVLRGAMGKVASAGTPLATSHMLLGLLDTDCDGARILEEEGASVVATLRSALAECPTDPPVVPDT